MSEKSYVTLEQHVCLVCCAPFDTNNLLLDTRLRAAFDRHTVTGYGLCPEHQKLHEDGYVALVACDPEKSGVAAGADKIKDPSQAHRTGAYCHLRRTAWPGVFGATPVPAGPLAFCDPGVIALLQTLVPPAEAADAGKAGEAETPPEPGPPVPGPDDVEGRAPDG